MKKKLTTVTLMLAAVLAATGCNSDKVTYKQEDGKSVIFSLKDGDKTSYYTADELLSDLQSSSTAKSKLYSEVSRQVFTQYALKTLSDSKIKDIRDDAKNEVDDFKSDCQTSAKNEGTDYDKYLEKQLESKGVSNLEELEDLFYYEGLKEKVLDGFVEETDNYQFFLQKYLDTYTPFQVKHILVAANTADANMKDGTMTADNARKLLTILNRFLNGDTFRSIATITDDTSSAQTSGIMPFNQAQNYVAEFRFATYAQEIFADNFTGTADEVLTHRYEKAADLHIIDKDEVTKEEFGTSNLYDVYGKGIGTVKIADILKLQEKVGENMAGAYNYYDYSNLTPTGKPEKGNEIPTIAEQPYEMNVSKFKDDGTKNKNYYEEYELQRNQIFNKTLNYHKVQYIELDSTHQTINSTKIKVYDNASNSLVEKTVLADGENGNPIFVALASTGIHFMSMVWNSYNPTSIVLSTEALNSLSKIICDNKKINVTSDNYYEEAKKLDDFENQLNYAYFTLYDSDDSNMEKYRYTYIAQNTDLNKSNISKNSSTLLSDISSYVSSLEYYLFSEIVYETSSPIVDDANHFQISFYDKNSKNELYDLIKEYVQDSLKTTDESFASSVASAAESYGTKLAREAEIKAALSNWEFHYDFD